MMTLEKCREAYLDNPDFHQFIDILREFMNKLVFTPGEMRQAVVFAACLEEQQKGHEKGLEYFHEVSRELLGKKQQASRKKRIFKE